MPNLKLVSTTWLVTIRDKSLAGEPNIAMSVVGASNEDEALATVNETMAALALAGRARCVARARPIELGAVYRISALLGGV